MAFAAFEATAEVPATTFVAALLAVSATYLVLLVGDAPC